MEPQLGCGLDIHSIHVARMRIVVFFLYMYLTNRGMWDGVSWLAFDLCFMHSLGAAGLWVVLGLI